MKQGRLPSSNPEISVAGDIIKHATLGEYVEDKVPSLKQFMSEGTDLKEFNIPSLVALSSCMRLLQRWVEW